MSLKNLINKSWYGSIGYLKNNNSIPEFQSYLQYNYPVLKEFKGHVFVFTYKECNFENLKVIIHELLPDAKIILIHKNRGHSFGIADSENALIDYCKENNIEWLCKTSNDVILEKNILTKNIKKADFYYMNGIGYGGMVKYNFDFDKIISEDFYPQTNFYFINISKIDYLYDKDYVNETYEQIQLLENYNGKIWEYIEGWSCEDFLKNCVNRNKLVKEHLVSEENYRILLQLVKENQIHDCSHKNIMIEGICHLQWPEKQIIKI
jgi:hypothetical protein